MERMLCPCQALILPILEIDLSAFLVGKKTVLISSPVVFQRLKSCHSNVASDLRDENALTSSVVFTPSLTVNRIKLASLLSSSASLKAGLDLIKWVPAMFLRLVEVTDISRKSLRHLLDNMFPSLATVYLCCVG